MCMLFGMSKQLVYAFPGFYNKETILITILRQIQTPQEVVVWFGCGQEKKKKKKIIGRNKEKSGK